MLAKATQRCGLNSKNQLSNLLKIISAKHSTSSSSSPSSPPSSPTVDQTELSHFQNFSSSWWDELGDMKALHSMNKLRIPFIRDGLMNAGTTKKEYVATSKPLRDLQILEVGCGGGILAEPLAKIGANVTGIDASPELIQQAKKHAAENPSLTNLTYSLETIENHVNNNSEKYHAVVASEVLEHVANPQMFLEDCAKCLKHNGSIFITTINKTTLSWLGGIVFAEYVLRFVPPGTHDWNKFIPPHQAQRFLEDNHCRTKIIHGMWYNFLTNSWSWMSDSSVNYALHAIKV